MAAARELWADTLMILIAPQLIYGMWHSARIAESKSDRYCCKIKAYSEYNQKFELL